MDLRIFAGLTAIGLLLSGCAEKVQPPQPAQPRFPYGPPEAQACAVAPFSLVMGAANNASLTVANDGGYCAIDVAQADGKPFQAALAPVPASHGRARFYTWLGKTSIHYIPASGFTGTDHFTFSLLVAGKPGSTTLNVSATVLPKGAPLSAAAPVPKTGS